MCPGCVVDKKPCNRCHALYGSNPISCFKCNILFYHSLNSWKKSNRNDLLLKGKTCEDQLKHHLLKTTVSFSCAALALVNLQRGPSQVGGITTITYK